MGIQIKITVALLFIAGVTLWFFLPKEQKAWYELLPDCPFNNPDKNGLKLQDGWAKDIGNLKEFHKGATECFRSYPAIKTPAGKSGQQCCYDTEGKLISCGSGAGTPDKVSSCKGEDNNGVMTVRYSTLIGHYLKDVLPFKKAGSTSNAWKKYNREWVPAKGKNCN